MPSQERSIAEYIFEKMEPFLTSDEVAGCAEQLQRMALDKLEEFGLSREDLEDMTDMISQDFLGMGGNVLVEHLTGPSLAESLASAQAACGHPGRLQAGADEGDAADAAAPADGAEGAGDAAAGGDAEAKGVPASPGADPARTARPGMRRMRLRRRAARRRSPPLPCRAFWRAPSTRRG